jgi:hypothetical protein
MTRMLSDWAKEFLREDRVGVVSTLNNDGSSHLTTMWYLLADDGTLVMSTTLVQQSRVALHFTPEKVTEFSVYPAEEQHHE